MLSLRDRAAAFISIGLLFPLIVLSQDRLHLPLHVVASDSTEIVKGILGITGTDPAMIASALASVILDTSNAPLKMAEGTSMWNDAFDCLKEVGQSAIRHTLFDDSLVRSKDDEFACGKDSYEYLEIDPAGKKHPFIGVSLNTEIGVLPSPGKSEYHLQIIGKCPTSGNRIAVNLRLDCALLWDANAISVQKTKPPPSPMWMNGKFCSEANRIFESKSVILDSNRWGKSNDESGFLVLPDQIISLTIEGNVKGTMDGMKVRVRFPDIFQQSGLLKRRLIQYPDMKENPKDVPGVIVEVRESYYKK